ncbi:MAG: hypothetical protein PHQ23_17595, partial [Candidatus Wallbacteria bacterium]|nr:hypothetical protein [Candidatus Wallbacteria bacterium]
MPAPIICHFTSDFKVTFSSDPGFAAGFAADQSKQSGTDFLKLFPQAWRKPIKQNCTGRADSALFYQQEFSSAHPGFEHMRLTVSRAGREHLFTAFIENLNEFDGLMTAGQRFTDIIELSSYPIILVDSDNRVEYLN